MKKYYIYIITNIKTKAALNVGLSTDLIKTLRFYQSLPDLFTQDQGRLNSLVYFEEIDDTKENAMQRFYQIHQLPKAKKIEYIEQANPDWMDITEEILNRHFKNPKFI